MAGAGPGRGAADRLQDGRQDGQAAPGGRGARAGRPGRVQHQAAPGTVRRPGPAGGHRARRRPQPGADHLRRGRVVAGRPHPGPGPQPVRAAAGRTRPVLPVHRARPRPGQAGQRPGGGDVPGQAVRGRAGRGRSTGSRCTRTPGRCWTRCPAPPRPEPRQDHPRRTAVAGPPAERLPVPHPLPPRRAALRGRGAGHAASWRPGTRSRVTSRWCRWQTPRPVRKKKSERPRDEDCASCSNRTTVPATTRSWRWPGPPRNPASTPSSAPTTTRGSTRTTPATARPTRGPRWPVWPCRPNGCGWARS